MAKRKRSRKNSKNKRSSRASTTKSIEINLDYDKDSCERQLRDLKEKINRLQGNIDALKVVNKEISEHIERTTGQDLDLSSYLKTCVLKKCDDIDAIKAQLESLDTRINSGRSAHDDRVGSLLLNIESTEEKLISEKAILTGKIASLEETRVFRDDLQLKFTEITRMINETTVNNKRSYHEEDLKVTVGQDRLLKEMCLRVEVLGEDFDQATKQRVTKSQQRTLDVHCDQKKRLQQLGERLVDLMGTNRSHRLAIDHLKRDNQILEEVRIEMHKRFRHQLEGMKKLVQRYFSKRTMVDEIFARMNLDKGCERHQVAVEFTKRTAEMKAQRQPLSERIKCKRIEYERLQHQCNELDQLIAEDVERVQKIGSAKGRLMELTTDVGTALTEAKELFDPAANIDFTERDHRRNHLLAAFFVLLHTANRICGSISPCQLGTSPLVRYPSPCYSAARRTGGLSSGKSRWSHWTGISQLSQIGPTRSGSKCRETESEANDSYQKLDEGDIARSPDLQRFGLAQTERPTNTPISAKLRRELSTTSRGIKSKLFSKIFRSIGVQATPSLEFPPVGKWRCIHPHSSQAVRHSVQGSRNSSGWRKQFPSNIFIKTKLPSEELLAKFRAPSALLHAERNQPIELSDTSVSRMNAVTPLPSLNSLASMCTNSFIQ
ncbi:unnamed protein product [Calicophoron daubneyi]|uniref:Cilia- and flagella-associated protein 157 n=1 Tax=Calicophoron daubneyi TaxID=300641 RepID=A0AAV2TWV1_CALDB